jgi:N-acetylglucosamine-6-phosphate deacetylase
MITHLFNAMPQLREYTTYVDDDYTTTHPERDIVDHREPGILGLLGMNQATSSGPGRLSLHTSQMVRSVAASPRRCDPSDEPPFTRSRSGSSSDEALSSSPSSAMSQQRRTRSTLMNLETDQFGAQTVTRRSDSRKPYWSIIADGVHVHPMAVNLAYQSHSEGCVLITDGE